MTTLKRIEERPSSAEDASGDLSRDYSTQEFDLSADQDKLALSRNLAKKETRAVHVLKFMVLLILLAAAALVSTFVYLYTSGQESSKFEDTFNALAEQITSAVQSGAQNKLEAIHALALLVQAYAVNSNSSWPFVTIPFFEQHVLAMKSLTDAYGVELFPIVTHEDRPAWEQYAIDNRWWVNQSYAIERKMYGKDESASLGPGDTWLSVLWGPDYANPDEPDMSLGIARQIFRTDNANDLPVIDNTTGPYFPQWQAASMSAYYQGSVNLNYGCFSDFYNSTVILNETGNAVNGIAWTDYQAPGYLTTMLYPVFDNMDLVKGPPVAFLSIDIFWESYLGGILPPGSGAVDIVIKNDFNQVFTFQIAGEDSNFTGKNDLHDTKFDHMEQQFLFGQQLMDPISSPTYTGTPLYGDFGVYTFYIYPTQELKNQYVTKRPIYYTLLACSIFLFTSIVFISYDILVERRQKKVMKSAITSDAIVSSLFPSAVKEQLYKNQDDDNGRKHEGRGFLGGHTNLSPLSVDDIPNHYGDEMANPQGPPIANLYPETTILFAGQKLQEICTVVCQSTVLLFTSLTLCFQPFCNRYRWFHCLEFR